MLLRDYVFWKGGVPSDVCDQIIKYGKQQPSKYGEIGGNKTHKVDKAIRKSEIGWVQSPWILDWIKEPVEQGNREIFKYNLNHLEPMQFTKYDTGQHYDWHIDIREETTQSRKLSMTVSLSDPSEYEGGELELVSMSSPPTNQRKHPVISKEEFKEKGTIIIFPSYIWHRIKPVTKGTRYSLVGWWSGPLFI